MTSEESWTQPVTCELTTGNGRLLRYCLYGPPDGLPLVFHSGSPSTRWKRPDIVEATEQSGVRMLVHDRPGYGGSTRQRGRTVTDVASDVGLLAQAQGWDRFAVAGASGGGPHALACAALMPDRVTRCAVSSGISPPDTSGPPPSGQRDDPRRNRTSWLAARGENQLRPHLEDGARRIMASIDAGGAEVLPDPSVPETDGDQHTPALASPASMARLRATFVDSHDGWVDDNIAFTQPWGFDVGGITVHVSIWFGSRDERSRKHGHWLLRRIPTAEVYEYPGGHLQDDSAYRRMLAWLRG